MRALRHSPGLAAALLLAFSGCDGIGLWSAPREHLEAAGSSSGSGSGASSTSGSGGTSSGSGTTGVTSGTTTSGTTTGSCGGQTAPAIHCARADGASSWFVIGEAPELVCSVDPGPAPTSWSGVTDPAYFTVDARNAPAHLYVGLPATNVPLGFGDTQVAVTVTATFCPGVTSSDVVHLPVVGNNLAADHWDGNIKAYASGGQSLGLFGAAVSLGKPNLVAALDNGDVLVGSSTRIVELDRSGVLVRDFDLTDHTGTPLMPDCGSGCTTEPWGAANDASGNVWLSVNHGRDSNGALYLFDSSGTYASTLPAPGGATPTYWLPTGIARRPDGAMLVTSGDEHDPAYLGIYPAGSTSGSYGSISIPNCTAYPDGGSYQCAPNSTAEAGLSGAWVDPDGTLFVSNLWMFDNDGDLAAYDANSLQFKRASPHTPNTDVFSNQWFRGLTRAGDWLLVAVWNGCVWAVDPQTLLPLPEGRGVNANHCIAADGLIDLRSVAHLGPKP